MSIGDARSEAVRTKVILVLVCYPSLRCAGLLSLATCRDCTLKESWRCSSPWTVLPLSGLVGADAQLAAASTCAVRPLRLGCWLLCTACRLSWLSVGPLFLLWLSFLLVVCCSARDFGGLVFRSDAAEALPGRFDGVFIF